MLHYSLTTSAAASNDERRTQGRRDTAQAGALAPEVGQVKSARGGADGIAHRCVASPSSVRPFALWPSPPLVASRRAEGPFPSGSPWRLRHDRQERGEHSPLIAVLRTRRLGQHAPAAGGLSAQRRPRVLSSVSLVAPLRPAAHECDDPRKEESAFTHTSPCRGDH